MATRFARKMKAKRLKIKLIEKDLVDRWKILRGDTVQVMTGKDAGKQGVVKRVLRDRNRLVVSGCNLTKRHVKKTRDRAGFIYTKESPLHMSNVMLIDPVDGKPTRVKWKVEKIPRPLLTPEEIEKRKEERQRWQQLLKEQYNSSEYRLLMNKKKAKLKKKTMKKNAEKGITDSSTSTAAPQVKMIKRKIRVSKRTNAEIPRPEILKLKKPRPSNPLKDTLSVNVIAPTFVLAEIEALKDKKLHVLEARHLNNLKQLYFNRIKRVDERRRKQEAFEKAVFEKSKEITTTRTQNTLLASAITSVEGANPSTPTR